MMASKVTATKATVADDSDPSDKKYLVEQTPSVFEYEASPLSYFLIKVR
jgi:hypothetical protein